MCGIVGYIGKENGIPMLLDALYRMEYRGYDSAGVAYSDGGRIEVIKDAGKIRHLEGLIEAKGPSSHLGIGHTRWATHGEPNRRNAHPHTDEGNEFVIVHNGVIENYRYLKEKLMEEGYGFETDTDTEVIVHFIRKYYGEEGELEGAVRETLKHLVGAYGLVIFSSREPDKLIGTRYGSPLVIGKGEGENYLASDVTALLKYTRDVLYLEDGDLVILDDEGYSIKNVENKRIERELSKVLWEKEEILKKGYDTYMLKEIYEQVVTVGNAIRGRLNWQEGNSIFEIFQENKRQLLNLDRIIITAMGTSFHAGLIGKYLIEEMGGISVEVDYAAELRYRGPIINEKTLVIAISQSGETADTLGALKEAKLKGALVLSICNVVGSSIARESHGGIFLHAGPEIGVASTKAFTSEVVVLILIGLYLGRIRRLNLESGRNILRHLKGLSGLVDIVLKNTREKVESIGDQFVDSQNILYLGRGYNYPVALEGALKLKEIAYIHAEGYNAAEMKHGPIALIDENMPVIFIALQDSLYEKVITNIEEVKARRGKVIAIATEGDQEIESRVDELIRIPRVEMYLSPILSVIPLQLLAYHLAKLKGYNVDQPRNLAKSVTVE